MQSPQVPHTFDVKEYKILWSRITREWFDNQPNADDNVVADPRFRPSVVSRYITSPLMVCADPPPCGVLLSSLSQAPHKNHHRETFPAQVRINLLVLRSIIVRMAATTTTTTGSSRRGMRRCCTVHQRSRTTVVLLAQLFAALLLLLMASSDISGAFAFVSSSSSSSSRAAAASASRSDRRSAQTTATTSPADAGVRELRYSANRDEDSDNSGEDVSVTWLTTDDETATTTANPQSTTTTTMETRSAGSASGSSKWDSLNPKIKERIVRAGQERAIANKKKREPDTDKKRRQLVFMKERQREQKRASKVKRPVAFDDRTPLAALIPGMQCTGVCISLTTFGAYVDVGTECDGLLHIAQMVKQKNANANGGNDNDVDDPENLAFVEHPRQVVNPGDEISVTVRSVNPAKKKLHLTMLPWDVVERQMREQEMESATKERIPLSDLQVDDELWGELKRVTDFGAYVEVGAAVDGFLHFMDHPAFGANAAATGGGGVRRVRHPTEFMRRGERVRVWVSDVDLEQNRIKLTANRPSHLPGPRRELS